MSLNHLFYHRLLYSFSKITPHFRLTDPRGRKLTIQAASFLTRTQAADLTYNTANPLHWTTGTMMLNAYLMLNAHTYIDLI